MKIDGNKITLTEKDISSRKRIKLTSIKPDEYITDHKNGWYEISQRKQICVKCRVYHRKK